jgi:beta-glucosidase
MLMSILASCLCNSAPKAFGGIPAGHSLTHCGSTRDLTHKRNTFRGGVTIMTESMRPMASDRAALISPPPNSPMNSPQFVFGVASAAWQIEGASNEDGRLPSIWDTFCATPGTVLNDDNGDVACDHYHRWAEDVDLIADLGVDAYRLSIAWPRVTDEQGNLNQKGVDFYRRLLDRLAKKGVAAYVTLYHWDLPQYLEDRGGWVCRETPVRFAEYADKISRALSGRVAAWATLNEPWCSAYLGYGNGQHAPGAAKIRYAAQAMHHLLLGHGLALPALRANDPKAKAGIVANVGAVSAAGDGASDRAACELYDAFQNRWVLDPLLRRSYPEALWRLWPNERPPIRQGDMEIIGQPIDFLGLNYYSRAVVSADGANDFRCVDLPNVQRTQMGWEVYPQGLQDTLERLHRLYTELPAIYIMGNGMASDDRLANGTINDLQRIFFLKRHFAACSRAMQNGVDVRGFFVWSLLDNFEGAFGYERRFGIVHVNRTTQRRTLKNSALAYADYLRRRAGSLEQAA